MVGSAELWENIRLVADHNRNDFSDCQSYIIPRQRRERGGEGGLGVE